MIHWPVPGKHVAAYKAQLSEAKRSQQSAASSHANFMRVNLLPGVSCFAGRGLQARERSSGIVMSCHVCRLQGLIKSIGVSNYTVEVPELVRKR